MDLVLDEKIEDVEEDCEKTDLDKSLKNLAENTNEEDGEVVDGEINGGIRVKDKIDCTFNLTNINLSLQVPRLVESIGTGEGHSEKVNHGYQRNQEGLRSPGEDHQS